MKDIVIEFSVYIISFLYYRGIPYLWRIPTSSAHTLVRWQGPGFLCRGPNSPSCPNGGAPNVFLKYMGYRPTSWPWPTNSSPCLLQPPLSLSGSNTLCSGHNGLYLLSFPSTCCTNIPLLWTFAHYLLYLLWPPGQGNSACRPQL